MQKLCTRNIWINKYPSSKKKNLRAMLDFHPDIPRARIFYAKITHSKFSSTHWPIRIKMRQNPPRTFDSDNRLLSFSVSFLQWVKAFLRFQQHLPIFPISHSLFASSIRSKCVTRVPKFSVSFNKWLHKIGAVSEPLDHDHPVIISRRHPTTICAAR